MKIVNTQKHFLDYIDTGFEYLNRSNCIHLGLLLDAVDTIRFLVQYIGEVISITSNIITSETTIKISYKGHGVQTMKNI